MRPSACLTAVLLMVSVVPGSYQFALKHGKQPSAEPPRPARPARPSSVRVRCYEDSLELVMQADLFDLGVPVDGRHLHLGVGSAEECDAVRYGDAEFSIHASLTGCGTQLSSTEDLLVYSNVLVYSPEPSPDGLLRLNGATIPITCQYQKRYGVDTAPVSPTWVPFTSTVSAENHLDFSLRLVTGDGLYQRGSSVYFLGEGILLEAAVVTHNHVPLRVFVDRCVATATPDVTSRPKYDFVENNGCLVDGQLTGSGSHFLPRRQEDQLLFVLDAFRFHQAAASDQLFISCVLKAAPAQLSYGGRACSFTDDAWRSLDGDDAACESCDASMDPAPETPRTGSTGTKTHRAEQGRWSGTSTGVWKRGAESEGGWSQTAQIGPLFVLPEVVTQARLSLTTPPPTTPPPTTAPQGKTGSLSLGALLAAMGVSEVLPKTTVSSLPNTTASSEARWIPNMEPAP